MAAFTRPSNVPIHSRYTGTSFCCTWATSTSGGRRGSADALDLVQPAATRAAGIKTRAAQVLILVLNAGGNVGQDDILRGGCQPPLFGYGSQPGPIDNRPQLDKLPHKAAQPQPRTPQIVAT